MDGEVVEDDDIALRRVGASWVSTQASKAARLIGPSSTQGATSRSARRPAMKVWVPAWRKGAWSTTRSPRRARPRARVMLVLVPHSSTKTSRCGASRIRGWRCLTQSLRAARTSARSRSEAWSDFFCT